MSKYVISSKVIARDLERNRESGGRRYYPGKVTALILVNLVLWILIFAVASGLDLV